MRALRIAVFMAGALLFGTVGANAQTSGTAAPAPAPATPPAATTPAPGGVTAGGQQVLTPEQIEELQAMVARMQAAMQDMVASARSTAGRLANGSQTIVLSTNEIAAIAIGAAGGAIVVDLLGGGGIATITGAVIGGVAAHWFITAPPAVTGQGAG